MKNLKDKDRTCDYNHLTFGFVLEYELFCSIFVGKYISLDDLALSAYCVFV